MNVRANNIAENAEVILSSVRSLKYPRISIVDLFMTHRCNFACPYCFVEEKDRRDTSWEVLKATIRFLIRESAPGKSISLVLFGGEPLMVFDLIRDFVPYARRELERNGRKADFSITTNGSLITPSIMQFFRGYGVNLLLSIDGGRESHNKNRVFPGGAGTFNAVARKIPMMKYFQPWLGARVTPTPETAGSLRDDVIGLFNLGINQFIIGCASGIDWQKASYRVYMKQMKQLLTECVELQLKKRPIKISVLEHWNSLNDGDMSHVWGCSAGRFRISVDVDGSIQACAKVQGAFCGKGFYPMGNVFTGFTEEAIENRTQFYRVPREERSKCFKCAARTICAGGCPATNYVATGSLHSCPAGDCYIEHLYLDLRDWYLEKMRPQLQSADPKSKPDEIIVH